MCGQSSLVKVLTMSSGVISWGSFLSCVLSLMLSAIVSSSWHIGCVLSPGRLRLSLWVLGARHMAEKYNCLFFKLCDLYLLYTEHIHGISWRIPGISCLPVKDAFWGTVELSCNTTLYIFSSSNIHRFFVSLKFFKIYQIGKCLVVYTMYTSSKCWVYTMKSRVSFCRRMMHSETFLASALECAHPWHSIEIDEISWKSFFSSD